MTSRSTSWLWKFVSSQWALYYSISLQQNSPSCQQWREVLALLVLMGVLLAQLPHCQLHQVGSEMIKTLIHNTCVQPPVIFCWYLAIWKLFEVPIHRLWHFISFLVPCESAWVNNEFSPQQHSSVMLSTIFVTSTHTHIPPFMADGMKKQRVSLPIVCKFRYSNANIICLTCNVSSDMLFSLHTGSIL